MRSVLTLGLIALLGASLCHAQSTGGAPAGQSALSVVGPTAKPDFSGTWILDTERSSISAPDRRPLPTETLVVKQRETDLTFNLDLGDGATRQTVRIDGERHAWTGRNGMAHEVEAKWGKDSQLVMTAAASRPSFLRITSMSWSLSADGKELTLTGTSFDRSWAQPNETVISEVRTTRVYRKR
jgi:hypothetical protein